MTTPETVSTASTEQVLAEVAGILASILAVYGETDLEITMDTAFHDDLEMESIDLVTLAGLLVEAYGPDANLAEYLAEKDLDEVIALTVGDIVRYVLSRINRG